MESDQHDVRMSARRDVIDLSRLFASNKFSKLEEIPLFCPSVPQTIFLTVEIVVISAECTTHARPVSSPNRAGASPKKNKKKRHTATLTPRGEGREDSGETWDSLPGPYVLIRAQTTLRLRGRLINYRYCRRAITPTGYWCDCDSACSILFVCWCDFDNARSILLVCRHLVDQSRPGINAGRDRISLAQDLSIPGFVSWSCIETTPSKRYSTPSPSFAPLSNSYFPNTDFDNYEQIAHILNLPFMWKLDCITRKVQYVSKSVEQMNGVVATDERAIASRAISYHSYSSPVASLVLTDSSQLSLLTLCASYRLVCDVACRVYSRKQSRTEGGDKSTRGGRDRSFSTPGAIWAR
uniref:Uncharacterized protein n=1 Tax=Timema douglasi TaxID=61478 RepID=A0A7R8ZDJ6_TIMDO|nr:unnamed protein product [Timema douglasi]